MDINYRKTRFLKVAATLAQCPDSGLPEIVLSGKSNVGKSSLVNAIADNRKLARVSSNPGKTREVIYFETDGKLLIADLPGYGYAKASKEVKEKFSKLCDDYFRSGRKISLVLHLVDIRHEPSKGDVAMLEFLNDSGLPYFLVFTKCDKLSKMQVKKRIGEMAKVLDFREDAYVFAVSSEKKDGIGELCNAITEFIF
ncbi:GTP-binding protein [Ruminococcaceae bacterium YRB3002]|nr:GTP-binding protein [Ruminococcaceae bacterium YRB3002]